MKLKRFKVMLCSFFMMFAISNVRASANELIDFSKFAYSSMDTFFLPDEYDYIYYQFDRKDDKDMKYYLFRYPAGTELNIILAEKDGDSISNQSSVAGMYLNNTSKSLLTAGKNTLFGSNYENLTIKVFGENPNLYFEGNKMSGINGVIHVVAPEPKKMDKISNVQHVFNEDNSITYTFDFPSDSDFSHLEIYQDNQLLKDDYKLNSIKISDLTPEMSYNFKFVSVDTSGNKSEAFISSVTAPSGPDLIAPLEVSEIKKVVSGSSIQFSYKLPIDDDFSHLQVWRNNVMIADNLKINSFNDNDLDYDTTYNYMFKSVDFTGNVSNGSSLTVKTMPEIDEIAPFSPAGVDVISGNASLFLSWSASPENDVVGYNVYIDGVKRNGSPVAGNSFRMTNLVNGQEYSLQVSAVDTSGNESELTQTFVGVPDSAMLPIFKVDTDLSAVAKSTENWFSQLWLVTAFSASIPIAFFVGGRVKALFFA